MSENSLGERVEWIWFQQYYCLNESDIYTIYTYSIALHSNSPLLRLGRIRLSWWQRGQQWHRQNNVSTFSSLTSDHPRLECWTSGFEPKTRPWRCPYWPRECEGHPGRWAGNQGHKFFPRQIKNSAQSHTTERNVVINKQHSSDITFYIPGTHLLSCRLLVLERSPIILWELGQHLQVGTHIPSLWSMTDSSFATNTVTWE